MERELGRKLLKGEIPVVPPRLMRCPAPNTPEFQQTCKDYEQGKIGYDEVLAKVSESIKPKEQPKPEGEQAGT